ncbi:MAG: AMP-binding protein [Deltaproteobacteria bacterium]|nr:AMP-binding protein [Deltaproteobacteria bacterium]
MPSEFIPGLFADELELQFEKSPDFTIMTFDNGEYGDETVTYGDIFTKGCKLAKVLRAAGIGKGDRFSLVMRNHPEFVYALMAASLIGALVVPIDPRSKGGKLSYQIKDSGSKGIILTNEFIADTESALKEAPAVRILGIAYKEGFKESYRPEYPSLNELLAGPAVPPPDDRNRDANGPFEIIYTSGTTGDPKGVVVKANRMAMFKLLAQLIWQYRPDDKLYTGLSLTHGNAQAVTTIPSLMLGIPCVISRKFTKSRIWDVCRKHGCTSFSLLGGMMMGIYSEPSRDNDADNPVRLVLSAGTPIPIWESFETRFNVKIHEWYGAVEGGFAHNPPGAGPTGSFGKPIEGIMEMKVVREDDTECAPGEIGELISRMVGQKEEVQYHGKKEASEAKTRGGWLRSGDMCHGDDNGWFFFDFRKGGGLRRQGDFIQPEFVEKALAELPEVSDVCVYGIPAESGSPGESDIVAAIVPASGITIDPKKIFRTISSSLDNNSIPSFLQVVEEIPKTASEKNLDRVLRDEFRKDAPNVHRIKD